MIAFNCSQCKPGKRWRAQNQRKNGFIWMFPSRYFLFRIHNFLPVMFLSRCCLTPPHFWCLPSRKPTQFGLGGSFYNQRLFNAQSLSLVDYLYTRDHPKIIIIVQPAHSCPASARQAGVYMFRSTFSFSFKKEKSQL